MKKRSCRRSEIERQNHEKAVKIRKMTDDQIAAFFDEVFDRGVTEGQKRAWATGGPKYIEQSV